MNRRSRTKADFFDFIDTYPREYYVVIFFLLFFFAIIWEAFSYTILNHQFYQSLADRQQIWEVEIPVTRGNIYVNTYNSTSNSIFSSSVDLNDIAIDPQITWDKSKLSEFLTDVLYEEMCDILRRDSCYDDLLRFLRVLEISDFSYNESFIKELILERVISRVSQNKITSVLLQSELTLEQEQSIISWNLEWVYPWANGLYINPEEINAPEAFAENYISLFGGEVDDVLFAIRQRDLRYIPIYNKLSLTISDKIEQYIEEENIKISQWILSKEESIWGFIILTPHAQRIYPEREVWSQIIWFLDNAGKWHYGIEWFFHEALKWNPWELVSRKDSKWRSIDFDAFKTDDRQALEGVDIYTTIDRNIQRKVETILEAWVKKYRANKWVVVVMEPSTWKILSLANYPSFDPNNPGEVYELKKVNYTEFPDPETDLLWRSVFVEDVENGEKFIYDGWTIYLREAQREEYADYEKTKYTYKNGFWAWVYQNDAVSWLYEPWSVMKAITVAVWIDTWEIKRYDFYNDQWKLTIDNFTISNVDSKCLWYNTFQNALDFSCNVWMIRIVQRIWKALLHKYLYDFGFWDITWITLEGEVFWKIDPYEKWPTAKLLTTSYGLGISVTPLQMATAYSVLANGGIYMKPYIVESVVYNDGKQIDYDPEPLRRVIRESTSETITDMLVEWVEIWAARNGWVEWYSVAGKTGTSQIAYRWGYEKWVASTFGSFAWYAPAEDPRFVIVVKLDRPRTSQYWGSTSAYLFSEIASELLDYYQIPKKN